MGDARLPVLSVGEETLALHLRAHRIPFEREVCLIPGRNWRVDFYLISHDIALEVEGGTEWGRSRHSKGLGFERDARKYNALALAGVKVLRFSTKMVTSGEAIDFVKHYLERA